MKLLYGYMSEEDKINLRPVVYANTITTMKALVGQASFFGLEAQVRDDLGPRLGGCVFCFSWS
ncbi:unnamed protein product [Discosporangium mesarthrocarpum]